MYPYQFHFLIIITNIKTYWRQLIFEYNFRLYFHIYQNGTDSTHKWNYTEKYGTQVVPKILYSKSTRSKVFNAVSTVSIAILDQKLQPEEKKVRLEELL